MRRAHEASNEGFGEWKRVVGEHIMHQQNAVGRWGGSSDEAEDPGEGPGKKGMPVGHHHIIRAESGDGVTGLGPRAWIEAIYPRAFGGLRGGGAGFELATSWE